MSGGYFDYKQYVLEDMASSIEEYLNNNENEYGKSTIERFLETSYNLRRAAEMAQRVDWFLSGDDSEDTFHKRWEEEVRPVY